MDTRAQRFNRLVGAAMRSEIDLKPGYSASSVSRVSGIERTTLGRYLSGSRPIPVSAVYAVAAVIDTPPEHIIRLARLRLDEEVAQGLLSDNVTSLRKSAQRGRGEELPASDHGGVPESALSAHDYVAAIEERKPEGWRAGEDNFRG